MTLLWPWFEQDGVAVHHGDLRAVLLKMPAGTFDLVLTDPQCGVTSEVRDRVPDLAVF